jgi:hypothetical protein
MSGSSGHRLPPSIEAPSPPPDFTRFDDVSLVAALEYLDASGAYRTAAREEALRRMARGPEQIRALIARVDAVLREASE